MPEPAAIVQNPKRQQTIQAVATFSALMHAYERGELRLAADAQAELAALGIVVRFGRGMVHDGQREGGQRA